MDLTAAIFEHGYLHPVYVSVLNIPRQNQMHFVDLVIKITANMYLLTVPSSCARKISISHLVYKTIDNFDRHDSGASSVRFNPGRRCLQAQFILL